MVSAVPVNSHGAEVASVTRIPSAAENESGAVISSAHTKPPRKVSGGLTITVRSPGTRVYQATAPQLMTNIASATAVQPVQAATSRPSRLATNSPTIAPRAVSLMDPDGANRGGLLVPVGQAGVRVCVIGRHAPG